MTKFEEFLKVREEAVKELELFVKDKATPLSIRWERFIKETEKDLLVPEQWIVHFNSLDRFKGWIRNYLENLLYDGGHRGECFYVSGLVEHLESLVEEETIINVKHYNSTTNIETKEELPVTQEDVINFKEECLDTMLYAFHFDW